MGRSTVNRMRRPAEAFRRPMPVQGRRLFRNGEAYPVCPQCGLTLEREYQAFCDRCGQRLAWRGF